ncbi:MAG: cbb3-type cytochrome c oxidase subunit I [Gemmatimonadota bacterium]|nr:cbb3-type cytochrome c oxidase subunit I [Gemmatimonadota bacterium]
MTSLVRRFLKTAIVFLAAGLAIGGWMIVEREFGGRVVSPYVVSAHTHAILVGFVMMMILGVALWMFPRPAKGDLRYRPALAEIAYWMLTCGTAVRVVGELMRSQSEPSWLRWVVVVAGLVQIAGLLLFFANMWSRIRAVGSKVREDGGERF